MTLSKSLFVLFETLVEKQLDPSLVTVQMGISAFSELIAEQEGETQIDPKAPGIVVCGIRVVCSDAQAE